MFKKGVSVYIGLPQYTHFQNLEYIRKAKHLGYEIVFTSADKTHITREKADKRKRSI